MAARASLLGDEGDSAPANWEAPLGTRRRPRARDDRGRSPAGPERPRSAHPSEHRALRRADRTSTTTSAASCPITGSTSATPTGSPSRTSRVPACPPSPAAAHPCATATGGRSAPASSSSAIPTRRTSCPQAPTPDELGTNGSFLVYRKLHQDVAAFRAQLARAAQLYPGGEELLAAKIVGRWRDGTPTRPLRPSIPDPSIVSDGHRNNAFSYSTDPRRPALSDRCPRPPRQPARQPSVRRQARQPSPPDPTRHPVRRSAPRRGRRRRQRSRRDLHVPAGEHRPPVRVHSEPVA